MKKLILALSLATSSFSVFALSNREFNKCPKAIKDEVTNSIAVVSNLEDNSNASEDLIDALSFSIPGTVASAPSCGVLKGLESKYKRIASELKN